MYRIGSRSSGYLFQWSIKSHPHHPDRTTHLTGPIKNPETRLSSSSLLSLLLSLSTSSSSSTAQWLSSVFATITILFLLSIGQVCSVIFVDNGQKQQQQQHFICFISCKVSSAFNWMDCHSRAWWVFATSSFKVYSGFAVFNEKLTLFIAFQFMLSVGVNFQASVWWNFMSEITGYW